MNEETKKCEKCGTILKKSGPNASNKKESMPSDDEPMEIYYSCRNASCENINESIKVYI